VRGEAGGGDAGAAYRGDGVSMTLDEIEQLALTQMAEFKVPESTPAGCVGTPWTGEKYAVEIDAMRLCLLKAHWQTVSVYDYPKLSTLLERREFAVVARDGDYTLLFDPQQQAFALGYGPDSDIATDAYPSGAVTTFAAR
jgi:hypothetical protein